jgi:hypothetical protein
MKRRKLTAAEVASIEVARNALRMVPDDVIDEDVVKVISLLREVERHRTTDGKPWIEPQPEIGDGYRRATWADAGRRDVEYFSLLKGNMWIPRSIPHAKMQPEYHYRVPIDRIPTDEDAVGRPTVMVRDNDKQDWQARKLLAVTGCLDKFITSSSSGVACFWMQARFPYPGELD